MITAQAVNYIDVASDSIICLRIVKIREDETDALLSGVREACARQEYICCVYVEFNGYSVNGEDTTCDTTKEEQAQNMARKDTV